MNKKSIHPYKKYKTPHSKGDFKSFRYQISFDGHQPKPFWVKKSQTTIFKLQESRSGHSDSSRKVSVLRNLKAAIPMIIGANRLEFNCKR